MSQKPPKSCVQALQECRKPECKKQATKIVTYFGQYPQRVCEGHVEWAWQRVREIASS